MNDSIDAIKMQMRAAKGIRIKIRTRIGRRGGLELGGIIDGLYPEVFTVMVKEHGYGRRYCFSYSEILTHHVEIAPYQEPLLSARPET
ncbi:MAG: Veg family protein [Christensenellales bacterium]